MKRMAIGVAIALASGPAPALASDPVPRPLASYLAKDTGRVAHNVLSGCGSDYYGSTAMDAFEACSAGRWEVGSKFSFDGTAWYDTTVLAFRRGSALGALQVYDESINDMTDSGRVAVRSPFRIPHPVLALVRMTTPDWDYVPTGGFTCGTVGSSVQCNPTKVEVGTQVFRISWRGPKVTARLVGEPVPTGFQWSVMDDEWQPVDGTKPGCEGVTATIAVSQGSYRGQDSVIATRGGCTTQAL